MLISLNFCPLDIFGAGLPFNQRQNAHGTSLQNEHEHESRSRTRLFPAPTNTAFPSETLTSFLATNTIFILYGRSTITSRVVSHRTHTRKSSDCVELFAAVSSDYESDSRLFWRSVRLTDERLAHILEHVEMAEMADEFERVLQTPSAVRRSRSDDDVKLFYEFYAQTRVDGKWLCVVVK